MTQSSGWAAQDGLWNKTGFTKTPQTSYGQQFQDPWRVLQDQKDLKESMQRLQNQHDSMVKVCDESLDSDGHERHQQQAPVTDQSFGPDDQVLIGQLGAGNIETEVDPDGLNEKPYLDQDNLLFGAAHEMRSNSTNSRRSQEFRDNSEADDKMAISELRESLADRKSFVAKSRTKLRSQAPTIESHHSKRSNQDLRKKVGLRLKKTGRNRGEDSAFDTKSLVSQRSMISKEQKREERSLNILTKRALNQLTDNSKRGDESSYFTRSLLAHNPHQHALQPHNGNTSRKAT